jgi:FkbM family methyltransferase
MRIWVIEKFIEFFEFILHLKIALYLRRNIGKPNLGDYIFDVGANKGSMTKLYLRLYKKINMIAFEPLSVFKFKSDQVKLMKVALGAELGSARFYVCRHNASSSLILPNLSSDWLRRKAKILGVEAKKLYNEIEVSVSTIDQVVAENKIDNIFLLKIDAEGGELNVIKGAVKSLRLEIIKNIQIESHGNDLRDNNKAEILKLLSNYTHQKTIKHYFGSFTEEFFSLNRTI